MIMAIKLVEFTSVKLANTKIPYYTNMVLSNYVQKETDEIIVMAAPTSSTMSGIGRFNCGVKQQNPEVQVEVYVTLDTPQLVLSEFEKDKVDSGFVLTEANSQVTWFRVGNQDSNGSGYFEFFSPFTFIKVKFIGTGTNSVHFAMN